MDQTRLAAVRATALLDTPPEANFDDLTRAAARFAHAPFAFATLVDDRRSYWKSAFGIAGDAPHQNTVEESFCQYVVNSGAELIVGDAASDARTCSNPSVQSMGVRAWAGFPLTSPGGLVLGSFCVVDVEPRTWTAEELDIIRTLAAAASREIALRSALREESLARGRAAQLAAALQSNLLPPTLPNVAGLEIAARYHPAGMGIDVGGDFYDFFGSGERWSFVLGDICGKGVIAARLAASARYAAAGAAMQGARSAEALGWLNRVMLSSEEAHLFLSAIYGTLEVSPGRCDLRIARAGHAPPIVRRANGAIETLSAGGPLLGILAEITVEETVIRLGSGDLLIAFTDGVDEARRAGVMFGESELHSLVRDLPIARACEAAAEIERAVLAYGGGIAHDDIAIVAIGVR